MQRTRCLMAPCSVLSKNLPIHHPSQRPLPWPRDCKGYGCSEDKDNELKSSLVHEEALGHVHRKKGDECNEGKNLRYPVGKDAEDKTDYDAQNEGSNSRHAVTASAFKYVHISIEWVLIHCIRYSQPRSCELTEGVNRW